MWTSCRNQRPCGRGGLRIHSLARWFCNLLGVSGLRLLEAWRRETSRCRARLPSIVFGILRGGTRVRFAPLPGSAGNNNAVRMARESVNRLMSLRGGLTLADCGGEDPLKKLHHPFSRPLCLPRRIRDLGERSYVTLHVVVGRPGMAGWNGEAANTMNVLTENEGRRRS